MLKKISKYQDQLLEARYAITHDILPHKIIISTPNKFMAMLGRWLRRNNLSNRIRTSIDPDKNGVWVSRR